jgi:hypothetical protein
VGTQVERLRDLVSLAAAEAADGAVVLADSEGRIEFALGLPVAAFYRELRGPEAVQSLLDAVNAGQSPSWFQGAPPVRSTANLLWTPAQLLDALAGPARDPAAGPTALPRRGLLPPLPAGEEISTEGRGLFGLINSVSDALLTIGAAPEGAIVVLDGRPSDAVAMTGSGTQFGPDAIDALLAAGLGSLAARRYPARLLQALPVYWRATEVSPLLPARLARLEDMLGAFLKPDQQGAVLIFDGPVVGVALFEGEQVLAAYRDDGPEVGGSELLTGLIGSPAAVVRAVVGPRDTTEPAPKTAPEAGTGRRAGPEEPARVAPSPLEADGEDLKGAREEICRLAERKLRTHASPALQVIEEAALTRGGLFQAIEDLGRLRIRLVQRASMEQLAAEARELLDSKAVP